MKKVTIFFISAIIFSGFGCKKWLDVNKNIDAPDYVEGYLYLANITQQYQGIYWDIRAIGSLTQMQGTTSYPSFAQNYYYLGSDAGGEVWRMVYWNQGMNLENMINQSEEASNWTLAGIGYAMKAFSWDVMTKIHGDLPMTEAFVPDKLSHNYDYQDVIYDQIREWAYKAIDLLQQGDNTVYGTKISANDFIYNGDKDKWIKFAYAVIVRNLISLSNRSDFTSKYAQELIDAANKSFKSSDDDATVKIPGGSASAPFSAYNNFWGTNRANVSWVYFQHEYAVQVMTGTVPYYDQATGNKITEGTNAAYPYKLADKQIVTDTIDDQPGHYDPRVAAKLGTASNPNYENIDDADSVKAYTYLGGSFTSQTGSIGTAPSYYGRNASAVIAIDGIGKWLYRDDAPYILTTYAEIQFCLAEAYWKIGQKDNAFAAFKEGVRADVEFTGKYIYPGAAGKATGGDKLTKAVYNTLADEYVNGPYVNDLPQSDFSLSHIMMQKWVALYPWGAVEAWCDMRKYHYDIDYSGDYPSNGNGWTNTIVNQKWDTDQAKVYKGFFLAPAQVQSRKGTYNLLNEGSPEYRLRPRYNSEYMWNKPSLDALKPISGLAANYHCSIPWFAYPNGYPSN